MCLYENRWTDRQEHAERRRRRHQKEAERTDRKRELSPGGVSDGKITMATSRLKTRPWGAAALPR